MAYRPTSLPPVPNEQRELAQYLERELRQLQLELASAGMVSLQSLSRPPDKLQPGLTVLADGTNWNPGSGAGVYTYYSSAWHKLG